MSKLQAEMAHLKPEIEEAINREIKQAQPQIERQAREAQRRAQDLKRQMRDMQREWRDRQREIERELRDGLEGSSSEF